MIIKEVIITKKNLMARKGGLAYFLAKSGDKGFARSEFAQDYDILNQMDGEVAYWLAKNSGKTGWKTHCKNILKLYNFNWETTEKEYVAIELAENSCITGWVTYERSILILGGCKVALELAKFAYKTGWTTEDEYILSKNSYAVAKELGRSAHYRNTNARDEVNYKFN